MINIQELDYFSSIVIFLNYLTSNISSILQVGVLVLVKKVLEGTNNILPVHVQKLCMALQLVGTSDDRSYSFLLSTHQIVIFEHSGN